MYLEKPQRNPEVGPNERGGRKRGEKRKGWEGRKGVGRGEKKRKETVERYIEVLQVIHSIALLPFLH